MTVPAGMAAVGAMSDAAIAREVAQLRQALGTIADQLNRLNGETKALHPKNHTPEMTKAIAKALSVLGALHAGFSQAPSGGGVSSSSNLQVKSLGVGGAASGVSGRIDLAKLNFPNAGATITFGGNNNSISAGGSAQLTMLNGNGGMQLIGNVQFTQVALAHGVAVPVDASLGLYYTLNVSTNIADVIQPPTNPPAAGFSQRITFEIRNTSGGALTTAPAFSAAAGGFRVSGLPVLANNQFYTVEFWYNSATQLWMQDGTASPAQAV